MINSIGLQNIGVEAFIRDKVPSLRRIGTPYFVNVFGYAPEDYIEVVRHLERGAEPAAYELNVSCPNTKHGGIFFGSDPSMLGDLGECRSHRDGASGSRQAFAERRRGSSHWRGRLSRLAPTLFHW
jgi:dihydroorotate dehydrogenase (NAD+) catalytic subunit